MKNVFEISFISFFGVATAAGCLYLTTQIISSISNSINDQIEIQNRKVRKKEWNKYLIRQAQEKQYLLELKRKRELREQKRIKKFAKDALDDFR